MSLKKRRDYCDKCHTVFDSKYTAIIHGLTHILEYQEDELLLEINNQLTMDMSLAPIFDVLRQQREIVMNYQLFEHEDPFAGYRGPGKWWGRQSLLSHSTDKMLSSSHEIALYSKIFNLIQDQTKWHHKLNKVLQEMALKNSDEFEEIENLSANLLTICQELKEYLAKELPSSSYHWFLIK